MRAERWESVVFGKNVCGVRSLFSTREAHRYSRILLDDVGVCCSGGC